MKKLSEIIKPLLIPVITATFSTLISLSVYLLLTNEDSQFTQENLIFLSFLFVVILSSIKNIYNRIVDIIFLTMLIIYFFSGPVKYALYSTIYYFYVYHSIELVVNTLLLLYIWILLQKFTKIPSKFIVMVISLIVFLKVSCLTAYFIFPEQWISRKLGVISLEEVILVEKYTYELILGFAALGPIIFMISEVFIRNRSVSQLQMKYLFQLLGIFLYFLNYFIQTFFVNESHFSPWVHKLLEVEGFTILAMWFISFRLDESRYREELSQLLWGVQVALVLPIVYTFFFSQDHRTFFANIAIFCFIELVFFLFYSMITVRNRLIQQGYLLYELADYLMMFWNRTEDKLFITDAAGEIIKAGPGFEKQISNDCQKMNVTDFATGIKQEQSAANQQTGPKMPWLKPTFDQRRDISYFQKRLTQSQDKLALNIVRDQQKYEEITRLHQDMQNKLVELKKMESLLNISGDISHNMNNFLTGIRGYCELMRLEYTNPEHVATYIDKIIEEVTRTSAYIQKVSDAVRPVPRDLEGVDLRKAFHEALQKIRYIINTDRIHFSIDWPDNTPLIMGIHSDLIDVFHHIIWNAVEAMPDGGAITVRTRTMITNSNLLDEQGDHPQEFIIVSISDTGTGIDENSKDYIFDPFFSTRSKVGKGLGLTIVLAIIKYHNATISFRNNPTQGTTFTLTFPIRTKVNKRHSINSDFGP